jgi:hypothetical protein
MYSKIKIELSKNSYLLRVVTLSIIVNVLRAGYRNKKQREAAIKTWSICKPVMVCMLVVPYVD